MAKLVAKNGPLQGRSIPLEGTEWTLGRQPDCSIVVDELEVSRHHARITFRDGGYYLEDLESSNHTYVDNVALAPFEQRLLEHGDEFALSTIRFQFLEDEPAGPAFGDPSELFVEDTPDSVSSTISSKLGLAGLSDSGKLIASPAITLEAMLEISRALGRALSLDEVLPQVLNSLFRIFPQADRGFIALLDDDGSLIPRWSKTRREEMAGFRVSRTIARQVMEQKEAILSVDASSDQRFDGAESIANFRIRSVMCVPLLDIHEEPIGILQIDTIDQRKRFQETDLRVLAAIATQASIAIDNARMHEQTLRQQAVERDLELAREVQGSFLPEARPEVPGFEFFDFYEPANHVGGDYFDYIRLPDNRVAVVVADVVGHGVAAALLMAKLSAEFRYCVATYPNPGEAITALNRRLSDIPAGRFITLVMAMLHADDDRVLVVNAGHMPPLVRSTDGSVREAGGDEEACYPVGILEDSEYRAISFSLEPGELMLLFTDGVFEASDDSGKILGLEAMQESMARSGGNPEQTVLDLVELARRHAVEQEDDMCLVAVKRNA